jgi:hypothetical protein
VAWWRRRRRRISLLVPFREEPGAPERAAVWDWLQVYWSYELPEAELVVGTNDDMPFSKTKAINAAARASSGDVFVILDSDCFFRGEIIQQCADRIRAAQRESNPLWFTPYRHIYRLTEERTRMIIESRPYNPVRVPSPPPPWWVESTLGSMHGHRYGALIQILPRVAFEMVGGMDERFSGWGGEDVSFLRALDTLYSPHKSVEADALHLWHPKTGTSEEERMWEGQSSPQSNYRLASRYNQATGDRARMRKLVDEDRSLLQCLDAIVAKVYRRRPPPRGN